MQSKLNTFGPGSALGSVAALKYPSPDPDLTGKVAVITGGNAGCGYETAVYLLQRGAAVILACRSPQRGAEAVGKLEEHVPDAKGRVSLELIDLASLESVRDFVRRWGQRAGNREDKGRIDMLICNAGMANLQKQLTKDGFEFMYQVNHLSHFKLVLELLPYVALSTAPYARIVNVSSAGAYGTDQITPDNLNAEDTPDVWWRPFNFWRGLNVYGRTKWMQVASTIELQTRLSKTPGYSHITVQAVHPGVVASGFLDATGLPFFVSAFGNAIMGLLGRTSAQGAMTSIWAAVSEEATFANGMGGRMWFDCIAVPYPPRAEEEENRELLWDRWIKDASVEPGSVGGKL